MQSEIETKINNMADIETIKNKLKEKNNPQRRMENIINYYKEMKPFNGNIDRIPDIPFVDEETYNNVIVPNLIRCGAISKNELIIGKTYIGKCRNASEAVWNGERFTYQRTKFGTTYPEDINHFQDDDGNDLFVPIGLNE